MRASLVHDAMYQLIRLKLLPEYPYRKLADQLMRDLCLADGMLAPKAWVAYWLVRAFASPAADPSTEKMPSWAP